jgi:hypothetical protein
MRKNFTYLLTAFLLFTLNFLSGQTQLWPTADSATIKASQFFGGLNGWTTRGGTVDANGNFFENAKVKWAWSSKGKRLGKSTSGFVDSIQASTASNGAVVFDSQYNLDTLNIEGFQFGEITSPTIDIDGNNNISVVLSSYIYNRTSNAYVTWSEDDGITWRDTLEIEHFRRYAVDIDNAGISAFNSSDFKLTTFWNNNRADLVKVKLAGSKGTKKFKIKLLYIGTSFYWIVDDIKLSIYNNDLQVNRNFFAVTPNFGTPKNQVEPIYFLSDISNQGNKSQTNVKLTTQVRNLTSGTNVFADTLNYNTIKPDSLADNEIMPKAFTPSTSAAAVYRGFYRIISDSSDQYRLNDTSTVLFYTSDSTFRKDVDGGILSYNLDGIWTNTTRTFRVGNYFYVPNGKSSTARSISTLLANAEALRGKKVSAYLLKWKQPLVDSNVVREKDITVVADGELTVPATATSTTFLNIPLVSSLSTTNKNAYLEDNTAYLAVIEYLPSNTAESAMSVIYDNSVDYGAMELTTALAGKPRRTSVFGGFVDNFTIRGRRVDVAATDYEFNILGTEVVPVVRLTVVPFRVNTNDILSDANKMEIYPNPTQNFVTLDFDLEKSTDVLVRIVNINGQIVLDKQYGVTKKERTELNVSHLPNGSYMMQILTADGVKTKQFTIAK